MDATETTLKKFGVHTGHSKKEMTDATKLAQKYLAVHSRIVPAAVVYPYIASDYSLLSLKTHTPPLESYSTEAMVDIPSYVYLMKNGYKNEPMSAEVASQFPALSHFRDTMTPKPLGEEQWCDYERTDHWKTRAHFMALNYKNMPEFHNLIGAICAEDATTNGTEVSDFYTRLTEYKPLHDIQAAEVGSIISQLNVDHLGLLPAQKHIVCAELGEEVVSDETYGDFADKKSPIVFVAEAPAEKSALDWNAIQQDALVQDYRKRAGLNVTFSPKKIVKQMIFSSLGLPITAQIIPKNRPLSEALPPVEKDAWPLLMSAVENMDIERHALDPESPALREILPGGEADAMSTIQAMLTLYHPDCELETMEPRTKVRYMKMFPQIDESVIKSIIEM